MDYSIPLMFAATLLAAPALWLAPAAMRSERVQLASAVLALAAGSWVLIMIVAVFLAATIYTILALSGAASLLCSMTLGAGSILAVTIHLTAWVVLASRPRSSRINRQVVAAEVCTVLVLTWSIMPIH
ncbi:MAG: hypothetical protein ABIJ46_04010 [bacterium]